MNVNAFSQKEYENEPPSGPKKQTQFKPNFCKNLLCCNSLNCFFATLINIAVQSCHLEYKKLFYSFCRVLLGQEINSNVYNSQRQSNCFMIRSLSQPRKGVQTRCVDSSQHGVLTLIMAVLRIGETKLKRDTKGSSDWLFFRGQRQIGRKTAFKAFRYRLCYIYRYGASGAPYIKAI